MKARVCRHISGRGGDTGGRYPSAPNIVLAASHKQTQNPIVSSTQTSQFPFSLCGTSHRVELKGSWQPSKNGDSNTNHFMSAEERGRGSGGRARASFSVHCLRPAKAGHRAACRAGADWGNQTGRLSDCVSMSQSLPALASVLVICEMDRTNLPQGQGRRFK